MKNIKLVLPYLGVLLIDFYLLPLLIINTALAMIVLLIIVPLICFAVSLIYGLRRPFCWYYCVAVAILFVPSIFMYYNSSAWIYIIIYGVIALIGNVVGLFFAKR